MQTFALETKKAVLLSKNRVSSLGEQRAGAGWRRGEARRTAGVGRLLTSLLMDTTRWVCWASVQSCESSILCRYISNSARAWRGRQERSQDVALWTVARQVCNSWRFWRRNSDIRWLHFRLQRRFPRVPFGTPCTPSPELTSELWPVSTNLDTLSIFFFTALFENANVHPKYKFSG